MAGLILLCVVVFFVVLCLTAMRGSFSQPAERNPYGSSQPAKELPHSESQPVESNPYRQGESLFTPAERAFLTSLDAAVGGHYRLFGKVRVADVIEVAPTRDNSVWQRAFNKISAKHFDFVLCRADDLTVVAAIELNDSSHRQRKRQERDSFLQSVCESTGLPLVQVRAQREYSVPALRDQIARALGIAEQPVSN